MNWNAIIEGTIIGLVVLAASALGHLMDFEASVGISILVASYVCVRVGNAEETIKVRNKKIQKLEKEINLRNFLAQIR